MSLYLPFSPADLASGYRNVRRRENTISLAPETWRDLAASENAWGVGAFCHHDDIFLLVRENGRWLLPGGRLERGETPETGACREVREETGVEITIESLAAIADQTFVNEANPEERFRFRFATFLATTRSPETSADPGLAGEGIDEVAWVSEIPENTFERDLVSDLRRSVIE